MQSIWFQLAEPIEGTDARVTAMRTLVAVYMQMGMAVREIGWHDGTNLVEMHVGEEADD